MKKILLTFLILFLSIFVFPTPMNISGISMSNICISNIFYFADDGSDSNDGRSELTPWQTIDKVNSLSAQGCIFKFKRGDTFRGNITSIAGSIYGLNIYTCYGNVNDPLPIIYGSLNKSSQSDWTDQGSNIWQCTGLTTDIGNIVFNESLTIGEKKQAEINLIDQGDFWYDFTNDLVKMYSVGNPGSVYLSIELCVTKNLFEGADYVKVTYLDFQNGGRHGVNYTDKSNGEVSYCNFYMIGGGDQNSDYDIRLGNAIQFWQNSSNMTATYNTISQCYDTGITPQAISASKTISNIVIRYNTIDKVEMSFEYWNTHATSTTDGVYFQYNTCSNAGNTVFHSQRWPSIASPASHVNVFTSAGSISNIQIDHNTFDTCSGPCFYLTNPGCMTYFTSDNNTFKNVSIMAETVFPTPVFYNTLSAWQTASNHDLSSTIS